MSQIKTIHLIHRTFSLVNKYKIERTPYISSDPNTLDIDPSPSNLPFQCPPCNSISRTYKWVNFQSDFLLLKQSRNLLKRAEMKIKIERTNKQTTAESSFNFSHGIQIKIMCSITFTLHCRFERKQKTKQTTGQSQSQSPKVTMFLLPTMVWNFWPVGRGKCQTTR